MSARGPHLGRLEKVVRRHANGWQRAVFSRPGAEPGADEQVVEGPGEVEELVMAAREAATAGRVKQSFILKDGTRVRIDARYGKAKLQKVDAETTLKRMGGKERVLRPDDSAPLLRAIGLMNADGTISAKNAKKYKQVNHFVELCRPAWERLQAHRTVSADDPMRVLDLACGNGYLTFVLAEALRIAELPARLHGVDVREDVTQRCRERASSLGWSHMSFELARIEDVALDWTPDVLLALHACDVASDEALAFGIRSEVPVLLVAPCCQRELAAQLEGKRNEIGALTKHGLLRRQYASTLTDALRVEILDACGYKVDVVEFVDSAHSAKNLLLRAHRRPGRFDPDALKPIEARCQALGVAPSLLTMLRAAPARVRP